MTTEQATALAGEFRAAADEARRLAQEFSPRELSQPPAAGAWSAADNLMHLAVASQLLVPRMTRTLGKLAEAGKRTEKPSRPDWLGRLYAWWLEPPVRIKVRAPKPFAPPVGLAAEEALRTFLSEQERVLALVDQSAGLDLAARKVPSPVSPHIRYNVYSAFRIVLAHERRHLWQARRAAGAVRQAGGN
ncbi:MAG TPA: DinB family protein [Vicinamibacteria bacterium]|nr:DinB family protein [Vicinamibacteria bacterium]